MNLVQASDGVTVSRRIYHDPQIFDLERRRIFRRAWCFVAHESEIPESGDYVTRPMGVDPVIVTRGRDGEVNVMLNSCTHRGVKLGRPDRGNTRHFRCPYHGWSFGLDGACRAVTYAAEVYGPGLDKSQFDLIRPARVDTLHGLVFATWDPDAPPLHEALGDLVYYLDAVFGKFDRGYEVMGAPVRSRLPCNWKSETENLAGDGYHTLITHETAKRFGLFPSPEDVAEYSDGEQPGFRGRTVVCGNGNSIRVQHLPITCERPKFLGYPESMWPEIERNLSPGQVDIESRASVIHGSVFPNLSFLENFKTGTDGPGSHCRYIRLTLKVPISEAETELWWWHLVPVGADEDWKEQSQRSYVRTNGAAGMFEIDDSENFVGMTEGNSGPRGLDASYQYVAGMHFPMDSTVEWPGAVQDSDRSEHTLRAYVLEWQRWMDDAQPVEVRDR
jgi:nitrite reductase/ring-hydroxylating ferredoxin subunit